MKIKVRMVQADLKSQTLHIVCIFYIHLCCISLLGLQLYRLDFKSEISLIYLAKL